MIEHSVESLRPIIQEVAQLLKVHHAEVEDGQWMINPDFDKMASLEEEGVGVFTTIRDDGKLIGYSYDWILHSFHYQGKLMAVNDGIYVDPEYRHLGLTGEFLKFIEKTVKEHGAQSHSVTLKVENPCKSLMSSLGYDNKELIWFKRI
jgi:GNAT superfamily N-acetyltransferase